MATLKRLWVFIATFAALALASSVIAAPATLASGSVVKGSTVFPNAVITYDPDLDASDAGSNPGIEVWADASLGQRLWRSNDNNGQWDYQIAGAYFVNNQAVIFGTRTGSHGPQGSVWLSPGAGSFLTRSGATVDCGGKTTTDGRALYGPFTWVRGSTTYNEAYVTYDAVLDASGAGSNPGLNVYANLAAAEAKTNSLIRANDNNGQWNTQVSCVYGGNNVINIVGARINNSNQTAQPRIWVTLGGSFLTQYAGIQ
jgi:hypothetical protein